MGGPLAALGLLSGCKGLDNDSAYYPRRQGTYLRIDTSLWWLPEGQAPMQLPLSVQGIAAAEQWAVALALEEALLYFFRPGQLTPTHALALPEKGTCVAARVEKKRLTLFVGTSAGLLIGETHMQKPPERIRWSLLATQAPVQAVAIAPSFTVAAAERALLVLDADQRLIQAVELPGPIRKLWIEHPSDAAGTWQGSDTTYSFSYRYTARALSADPTQPSPYRYRLTSPYLRKDFGTEYTGAITLTAAGDLSPGGHKAVESFSGDFLGGWVFFLRKDTLWSYLTAAPARLMLQGTFLGVREVESVPVYRYGSTEVTTK